MYIQITTRLWTNEYLDITFTCIVDNFRIKYNVNTNLIYLIEALETKYTIIINYIYSFYADVALN